MQSLPTFTSTPALIASCVAVALAALPARAQAPVPPPAQAAAPAAAQPPANAPSGAPDVAPGSKAQFLAFLNAPLKGDPLRHPPKLSLSVGGGPTVRAVMDTGSTGVVVAARLIPDLAKLPVIGRGELTYGSSGRIMRGTWVRVPLTLAGAGGTQVTTRPLPVLAVERVDCLPTARRCKPVARPTSIAMLGVGFARQPAAKAAAQASASTTPQPASVSAAPDRDPALEPGSRARNPFLSLSAMGTSAAPGAMRQAYVVTRRGVWLGLTPELLEGFRFVKLQTVPATGDWGALPACISVDRRSPPACGTALLDTGLTSMFLTLPNGQTEGRTTSRGKVPLTLAHGTPLAVTFGGPGSPLRYGFDVGEPNDPVTPSIIHLTNRPDRVFVNTGVRILNAFDYLYDAQAGFVGLRPVP
ncbi:MAG: hypothetical protein AB1592_18130 [Pseudomonadota bacterium]